MSERSFKEDHSYLMAGATRWWELQPAQGQQAKVYTCPFCHARLLAMTPNTLLFPEGDHQRRRHAHTECVIRQRKAGGLPTREEWERAGRAEESATSSWLQSLLGLFRRR